MSLLSRLGAIFDRSRATIAYDVTIASVGGTRTVQFRIRRSAAVAAVCGLAALLLVILAGAVTAGHQLRLAAKARALRAENAEFRRQLTRMAEMEDRVRSLEDTRKALLQLIGADDESAVSGGAGAQGASDGTGGTGQPYTVVDPDSLLSEAEATEIKGILRLPPLRGPRTRGFGRIGSGGFFHTGVDVAGDVGTEIASPGDGVATFIGTDDTLGEVLVINHDPEIETVYGHNSSILVKVGDGVTAGQSIALLGNTGRSSAPHLHFEVHWRGKAIDPETVYPSYWQ